MKFTLTYFRCLYKGFLLLFSGQGCKQGAHNHLLPAGGEERSAVLQEGAHSLYLFPPCEEHQNISVTLLFTVYL